MIIETYSSVLTYIDSYSFRSQEVLIQYTYEHCIYYSIKFLVKFKTYKT